MSTISPLSLVRSPEVEESAPSAETLRARVHGAVDDVLGVVLGIAAAPIVTELRQQLLAIPKTGPGNKGRRERLEEDLLYLERRLPNIRYGSLRRRDLEIGTGAVEGAVKRIIGQRCDHGGMRWIRERVEAVVQLRCIEVNGQWHDFEAFAHRRMHERALVYDQAQRLQTSTPTVTAQRSWRIARRSPASCGQRAQADRLRAGSKSRRSSACEK